MFAVAASSVSAVTIRGAHFDSLSAPLRTTLPERPAGPGSERLTSIITRATADGTTAFAIAAAIACGVIVS